jgi:hypothetical protein
MAVTDERAGLRGEYEIILDGVSYLKVHQMSPTYMFASKQGVSGGDENAEPDIRICHNTSYVWHSTPYVYNATQVMSST